MCVCCDIGDLTQRAGRSRQFSGGLGDDDQSSSGAVPFPIPSALLSKVWNFQSERELEKIATTNGTTKRAPRLDCN